MEIPEKYARLAAGMERFGRVECAGNSLLYEQLSYAIAADPDLLEIVSHRQPGQPAPNMIFAATHYLLLKGTPHPLSRYYRSLHPEGPPDADPAPSFRDFCLTHREELIGLIRTRLVQTNEARRSGIFYPAFGLAWKRGGRKPLALLEIGPSAGLNLLWDKYGFCYGETLTINPTAELVIDIAVREQAPPPLPDQVPEVIWRTGLDLNPVDLTDPDAVLWLRALIWPEHTERAERFLKAAAIARQSPPRLLAGNALELLPEILPQVPPEATLCLFHSFTLNQFSPEMKARLVEILTAASHKRDIFRLSFESQPGERSYALLAMNHFRQGIATPEILAESDGHARWIKWLGAR